MKKLFFLFLLLFSGIANAQGEHDHDSHETSDAEHNHEEISHFSSENYTDKYELLAKYNEIQKNEETHFVLYLSDYKTNKALDAKMTIQNPTDKNMKFELHRNEQGIYEVHTTFFEDKTYALNVTIDGPNGPDLIQLKDIIVGKKLTDVSKNNAHTDDSEATGFKKYMLYILMLALVVLGFLIGMFYQKNKMLNGRTLSILLIFVWLAYPMNRSNAHEGHDNFGGGNLEAVFEVPKETQFLLNVLTQQVGSSIFNGSVMMYGTVIPSTTGSSVITAPLTGKISLLNVKVGDKVKKGQKIGTITAFIDVNTQVAIEGNKISVIQMEAERNSLQAELKAAQLENDRLQKIADIASKKDVDEAKARLEKAKINLELFNKNVGQGKMGNIDKFIALYSPISGTINEFSLTQGSTVNIGQELLKISNIDKVYIEGQIYDRDIPKLNKHAKFEAQCVNADHKATIKLISNPQIINSENQSQKILFELENKDQDFKIGEFVNIRMFSPENNNRGMVLPNSAITEINGKSIVFIKGSAEKYKLHYVNLGENNGSHTRIEKGLEGGERVVTNSTYQMKMIYLNQ